MRLGIDASNLRGGGGITHLSALLTHVDPHESGIERVVVWGSQATLDQIPQAAWLEKSPCPELEGSPISRLLWRSNKLPQLARDNCELLFAPGGLCSNRFHPVVTMSRNMLPFQWEEMGRYGPSAMWTRLVYLRFAQARSFRTADGVIFLSQFAQSAVRRITGPLVGSTAVIPHGVAEQFFQAPRPQRELAEYSAAKPLRILYTSIIDVYKHAWNVVVAAAQLRSEGLPICVDFVGSSYPKALKRFLKARQRYDPNEIFVRYLGPADHRSLPAIYHAADAFVFASSCENLPNILLEAMASGLPIASSRRGPMAEILGGGGVYFDPLRPSEIADALRRVLRDAVLRRTLADAAYARARTFTWDGCARKTFGFLRRVFDEFQIRHPADCAKSR